MVDLRLVRFDFALDIVRKAGYSGGTPYYMIVSRSGADNCIVTDSRGEMQFVDYLRHAILDWSGFPGFGRHRRVPVMA